MELAQKEVLRCDECGTEKEIPDMYLDAIDKIKYVCDNFGWTWGGCNIALLCDECKEEQ